MILAFSMDRLYTHIQRSNTSCHSCQYCVECAKSPTPIFQQSSNFGLHATRMSFKRRQQQQPKLPPGSRLSAYNGQLLISTGVPSLDDILGGGLPVGTVLLIREDRATAYAQLLLKYFIAQGIASGHHCALASRDDDPSAMLRNLMWLATSDSDDADDEAAARSSAESDRLKIAWRYAHLKTFETTVKPGKHCFATSQGTRPSAETYHVDSTTTSFLIIFHSQTRLTDDSGYQRHTLLQSV